MNIQEMAKEAFLNRLWACTVGVVNGVRTVGVDPSTGKRADEEVPATASAVRWGDRHFMLTAKHVVEKAQPASLRFFCRPTGRLEYQPPLDIGLQDCFDAVPQSEENATIYRCEWEDLALMTTVPRATGPHVEFFDIANAWIDPPESTRVHCFAFPRANSVVVEHRLVGSREERTLALIPTAFTAEVLPCPDASEQGFMKDFVAGKHYLVPYADAKRGLHPRGISGAAMWVESDERQIVWSPRFKFAGVCTGCYKSGTVLQVVRASVVRQFLEESFGPPV